MQHFPWIQDALGIQSRLDLAHKSYSWSVLGFKKLQLSEANPVLSGACPVHGQGA
jgi:hypothetical protein